MVDLPTNDESATLAQARTNRVSGRCERRRPAHGDGAGN